MKATELRIGDWVLAGGERCKVAEVDIFSRSVALVGADDKFWTWPYEDLKPIPLTCDVLARSGWDLRHFDGTDMACKIPITDKAHIDVIHSPGEDTCMVYAVDTDSTAHGDTPDLVIFPKIRYVHELQHLVWALGIENEIEL